MQITVISVSSPETRTKGKNKWQEITLAYKSDKGDKEKKFPSYVDIYEKIKELEAGATYDVRLEKDGDYWQWVAIEKVEGAAAPKGRASAGGTDWAAKTALDRERFEFDKEKQVLIIRQSMVAVAQAIAVEQGDSSVESVIDIAEKLVDYVQNGRIVPDGMDEPDVE